MVSFMKTLPSTENSRLVPIKPESFQIWRPNPLQKSDKMMARAWGTTGIIKVEKMWNQKGRMWHLEATVQGPKAKVPCEDLQRLIETGPTTPLLEGKTAVICHSDRSYVESKVQEAGQPYPDSLMTRV